MNQPQGAMLNYEQLGEAADKINTAELEAAAAQMNGAAAAAISLPQVCGIYRKVRPVLALVSSIPLIPAKIRNAISTFMSAMDMICPAG